MAEKKYKTKSSDIPWDFKLPRIEWPQVQHGSSWQWEGEFDPRYFVYQLQTRPDHPLLSEYLGRACIDSGRAPKFVENFPLLYYIVASTRVDLLRLAISMGCNVNVCPVEENSVPLLPFAIIYGQTMKEDKTYMIIVLLAAGAKVLEQIPSWYLASAITEVDSRIPFPSQLQDLDRLGKSWYSKHEYRQKFRAGIDMHMRHCFRKALKIQVRKRNFQLAYIHNAEVLMELPYSLIGQFLAAKRLQTCLLERFMTDDRRPLILCLAGPSGHGKTELALKLGSLLNVDVHKVDCASGNDQNDFFGIAGQYHRGDISTPLNSFLLQKDGEEGIIILDEFEKTGKDFHNGLLNPFDRGEYKDRVDNLQINCKQLIWILTTNHFDSTIANFYESNTKLLGNLDADSEAQQKCYKELMRKLRKEAVSKLGAPITGRISEFIPFLPFNQEEQVVGVEKLVKAFVANAKLPVTVSATSPRPFGNVELSIVDPVKLCKTIAENAYMPELGIRSLENAVRTSVKEEVFDQYLSIPIRIKDPSPTTAIVSGTSKGVVIANVTEYDGRPLNKE